MYGSFLDAQTNYSSGTVLAISTKPLGTLSERSARGIRPLGHDALGAVVQKDTREGRRTQEMPYSVRLEYGIGAGEFTIYAQLPNVNGEHDHCQGQERPEFVKARFAPEEIGYAKKDHRE